MKEYLLKNGVIWTADSEKPRAESLLIRGERIAAVGNAAAVEKLAGRSAERIDLEGGMAVPGFQDSHLHFGDGGTSLLEIDLRDSPSEADMGERLRRYAANQEADEWITGGYWNQERWNPPQIPCRQTLDDAGIRQPVLIKRIDTHMALANSRALEAAGIGSATPDPAGGEIVRDGRGNPTGILKDTAIELVQRVLPPPSREKRKQAILAAMAHANRFGITSIQDNASALDLELYSDLSREGKMTVRVNAWRGIDCLDSFRTLGIKRAFGDAWLRIGTVKVFADGALGAGTAWMHDPYEDNGGNLGLAIHPRQELIGLLAAIAAAGLQISVHAIGDRANTWALDALDEVRKRNSDLDLRHRIEHAQIVRDCDLDRLTALAPVVSVQPAHFADDISWAGRKIGRRVGDSYRWKSFADRGIPLIFGSDWPVEPINPLLAVAAAVNRAYPDTVPEGDHRPGEALSLAEALSCHTRIPAWAEFQEREKGLIQAGLLADLLVLDRDLFAVPPGEIDAARVDMTFVAGRPVYIREG